MRKTKIFTFKLYNLTSRQSKAKWDSLFDENDTQTLKAVTEAKRANNNEQKQIAFG